MKKKGEGWFNNQHGQVPDVTVMGFFSITSRTRLDCQIHMVYLQCRMILFETVNHFESHEKILGRRNMVLHFGNESKKYKEKNVAKKTHFLEQS